MINGVKPSLSNLRIFGSIIPVKAHMSSTEKTLPPMVITLQNAGHRIWFLLYFFCDGGGKNGQLVYFYLAKHMIKNINGMVKLKK